MTPFYGPILAIESSCDETSVAIVEGFSVRANIVATQIEMHKRWGGVVPEAAARAHVEAFLPTLQTALFTAGLELSEIGAIAVTNRPGLIGALSVGVSAAKALALRLRVPLLGIHHLEGHLLSTLAVKPDFPIPYLALIVSGGHTELVLVRSAHEYQLVGETLDDAAGEAFDKGARLMGLGYPGGRAIQEQARMGNPHRYPLPRGLKGDTNNFSFSGLKTAMLRLVEKEADSLSVPDAAASLQQAIVSVLAERTMRAAEQFDALGVGLVGGVAANESLRSALSSSCERAGVGFVCPPIDLCTDNAAMIGLAASTRLAKGQHDDFTLDVLPNSPLP
jgi:N6-L-threonylcarbamoyladenine synthase